MTMTPLFFFNDDAQLWQQFAYYYTVEVPNSQRISCLDSSLGRVPACDVIMICITVGAIRVKVISQNNDNNSKPFYI